MVWSIGSVTLPYGPSEISDDGDCETENMPLDGGQPIIFSKSPGMRVVVWSGTIRDSSYSTKRALESHYCSVLRGFQGAAQAVVCPSGAYTGTWYIKKVAITEQAEGTLAKVGYTITMWLGSGLAVI